MNNTKKKLKWWQILLIVLSSVLAVTVIVFFAYFGNYSHAVNVDSYLKSTETVTYSDDDGYYSFTPKEDAKTGIILYPGAKVEAKAYSPLCMELADKGYYVALVRMPFNFALFQMDACEKIRTSHTEITDFYLAGHSLGGVAGSFYVSSHPDNYKGLIFLASFTTKNISETSLRVLSIYGDQDGVLNKKSYEKDKVNLPSSFEEHIIKGGNHAGYASYGKQSGDNDASITQEEQRKETADTIDQFLSD